MKAFPLARMIVPSLILIAASFAVETAGAAPTTCKDGTTSIATGRGACSGHGGVQKASAGSSASASSSSAHAATPPASSVPASGSAMKAAAPTTQSTTTGDTAPTGATAKCKDGTYSKSKQHSGACSKHGGVDQWMDGSK